MPNITSWVPAVRQILDGTDVKAATVNSVLEQYTQRDQHLYEKFNELTTKSVLVAYNLPVHPTTQFSSLSELNVVYLKTDVDPDTSAERSGVAKALTGFSSEFSSSVYSPLHSSYALGIVKELRSDNTIDVYLSGLIELPFDIDDIEKGLLQVNLVNSQIVEEFRPGPYYLSRAQAGKLTSSPSSIPVYIGYALNKRQFFLNSSVDEFSQLFINYRFNVLDRPAYTPSYDALDRTWSILVPTPGGKVIADLTNLEDCTKLGWVPVSALPSRYNIPSVEGLSPKFFYYIPEKQVLDADTTLLEVERKEASELKTLLPPAPANFVNLTWNGVIQRYRDPSSSDGVFYLDSYGLWLFYDTEEMQPWARDLLEYGAPDPLNPTWELADWLNGGVARKGSPEFRPRIFIQFARFNPDLKKEIVSSLTPYAENDNNTGVSVTFVSKEDPSVVSSRGDLLMRINHQFQTSAFAASATALSGLTYDQALGKFVKAVTPVVSSIEGVGDIDVTVHPDGRYSIGYQSSAWYGEVSSIELVNARIFFAGLDSYISLPYNAVNTGLIGKIVCNKNFPENKDLYIRLVLFGKADITLNSANRNIGLQFAYSSSKASYSSEPGQVVQPSFVGTAPVAPTQPVSLPLTSAAYVANKVAVVTSAELKIPAAYVAKESVVNFRLIRANVADEYPAEVGILATYWQAN